jgi:hypothetical protein
VFIAYTVALNPSSRDATPSASSNDMYLLS